MGIKQAHSYYNHQGAGESFLGKMCTFVVKAPNAVLRYF